MVIFTVTELMLLLFSRNISHSKKIDTSAKIMGRSGCDLLQIFVQTPTAPVHDSRLVYFTF